MSSGKWYCEVNSGSLFDLVGIAASTSGITGYIGQDSTSYGYYGNNGNKYNNGSAAAYGATFTSGDVIGIAFDADAGTLTFYKNGVSQGTAYTGIPSGTWYFAQGNNPGSSWTSNFNFGQRPFAYTAPSGFKALVTTNLPEPTIKQGDDYFNAVLYTGNGSTQSITSVGFQPDLVWIKDRTSAYGHILENVISGAGYYLTSSATDAETAYPTGLTSFNSNGFSLGSGVAVNNNTDAFVAWNWKANGAGSTNTAGTITSTVSANTTSGVSIITYTGNGTSGATVGHGLGVAPRMIIVKVRSTTNNWPVYHVSTGNGNYTLLNSTAASASDGGGFWNNTTPSSSVITLGSAGAVNASGATFVAYCFAAVPGFSAFGSYTGNGSADGAFVYTGFRPRFVLIKSTAVENWTIQDSARSEFNVIDDALFPALSNAESTANANLNIDFLSNGFKVRSAGAAINNTNAQTYIYAAFAENPFKYSNAR
jgi:hypothetical protein